ncbi:MAG: tetratricopeptide repeat protein, partial [Pirellulaceae bacterium]
LGILDAGQDRSSSAVLLHAEVGRLYLALKKYPEAAEGLQALDRALLHPEEHGFEGEVKTRLLAEQARLWPLIGESLLRVGRFADAEDRFRRGHEAKPNAPLLAFHLARIAAEKRDWTTARAELEKYRAAPGALAGEQAYELLSRIVAAEVMDQANRQSRLIEELARWRDQDRGNATLAYYLAGQYVDAGQTELALRLYEELLGGEPRPDALRALARMYHKRRDTASMLRLFDKTPASLLANEEPWAGIARDEEYWHGLLAALVPAAGASAYGANPSGNRYVGTALLGIHAEQWDTVEKLFGQALDLPGADGDNICETVGLALLRAEQPARAARIFQRAVSRLDAGEKATSANRASSYFYLAAAEAFAGHTDAALAAAEKCAELMPDSVQFQARPAWVLYHAKRWSDSEPRYRKVLEQFDARFDSESQREQVKQLRLVLSNICVMEQRIAEAEEWLEQVLDEFPEDPGALNDLGYLWVDQSKRLQRALGMCQQAVRAEPENGAYRDSLGWAYFRLHRFEEAIQELEMAARLTPDGVILDHLGDAYRGAQQRDKALSAWQRAVEAFRQDDEAEKRRQTEDKLERLRRSQPS